MNLMTFRQELIHVFLVQINQKCFYLENVRDIMLDSGTTVALVPNKKLLYNIKDESNIKLLAAGQNEITVEGEGILKLKLNENISIEMKAMIVPSIKINIIPLASLYENNLYVDETCDNIKSLNGETITSIFKKDKLLWISGNHIQLPTEEHKVYQTTKSKKYKVTLRELHRRLGHTNVRCVRETVKRGGIEDLSMSDVNWEGIDEFQCESCMKGKASRHPHIKNSRDQYNEKYGPFEYIHTDIFGPIRLSEDSKSYRYMITFTDECTRYTWTIPLYLKTERQVRVAFLTIIKQTRTQYNKRIKVFHMDRGSEYTSEWIRQVLKSRGVKLIYTTVADSRGNGVAERLNRTLLDRCRTLLDETGLSKEFWYHAIEHVVYDLNHTYKEKLKCSPIEKAGIKPPKLKHIHAFGQLACYRINTNSKLDNRAKLGYLLHPSQESYGYIILDAETNKLVDTTDFRPFYKNGPEGITEKEFYEQVGKWLHKAQTKMSSNNQEENNEPEFTTESHNKRRKLTVHESEKNKSSTNDSDTVRHEENLDTQDVPSCGGGEIHSDPKDDSTKESDSDSTKLASAQDSQVSHNPNTESEQTTAEEFTAHKHPNDDFNPLQDAHKQLKRKITETVEDPEEGSEKRFRVNYVKAVTDHDTIPYSEDATLSYSQAITGNKNKLLRDQFTQAFNKEINQMRKMHVWDENKLIDISEVDRNKVINPMLVFSIKRDGTKKCRLVARGDQQDLSTYSKDRQQDTINNMALMTVLAVALDHNLIIKQLDISSAYLYADLKEEIYIRAPPHIKQKGKVLRLNKSLYGLKQSGANWQKTIKDYLKGKCELEEMRFWPCVFTKGKFLEIIVCLFVDDIVIAGNNINTINQFITDLQNRFDTRIVNDGSPNERDAVRYDILGIDVEYKKGVSMKFGMLESLTKKLPLLGVEFKKESRYNIVPGTPDRSLKQDLDIPCDKDYDAKVNWIQRAIGLCNYVAMKYRFDIAYYTNILAQHQLYPSDEVLYETERLLQYLWTTRGKRLVWKRNEKETSELIGLTDASHAKGLKYKSQAGYFCIWNGKKLFARSTRTSYVCESTAQSETYAASECLAISRSINYLLTTLTGKKPDQMLLTDNKALIDSVKGTKTIKPGARHNDLKLYAIKDKYQEGQLKVEHIPTDQNEADLLTKPLKIKQFKVLTDKWMK
ncbi:transposon Ty2-LR1 Gag-Pol polyprotein [Kluyveromyces marxianus]|uniref:Transposon Ty2-LR1 Gag-Pol polyprotein n=2 Tax=Kluyveromyces marxianus TaxID=4911 RepID=W0TBQ3_KLUMD|nr:transposon Ty2-LR1 Gag-Pol polyprotein [Kluyveromyces marxianus DMKU3-1042]XP_022676882.1 transposon Ty2-LR1 Gag-Pol polyprotein [Kluyveromyces marxianus DMKU3-1042]QGN14866.1 transposon Ty2-LR1 Gag-Pol polyprotein [Kluyveromyces marxianus]QGN15280.1 transposon Ty2-LR1 Gag-Pol polyprotein [Kluyveromyces marxianus]BAO40323.1 transposon Ty2-LR1 Gag-Pol polyprotein [Kluyveromyces marxianus DMKU3-1042]BAO41077.1 transposon Ty2-LR1 Gag-Pol polyprotein [Kluyveromyces marxianus DMKU3-1042]